MNEEKSFNSETKDADLSEILQIRRDKLSFFQEQGRDPF